MSHRDLQEFVARLEEEGELHRVPVEVDPVLEIAEITNRMSKSPGGGKALFFERVRGSDMPVVTNLFGSHQRLCTALGIPSPAFLTHLMEQLLREVPANGPFSLAESGQLAAFAPRTVVRGSCQEVTETHPDLGALPVLKSWPDDGLPASAGRFITLPLVITRDPTTGAANCGMYRVEVFGRREAGIHWRPGSGGAEHYGRACACGERLPVAVVLGGDPASIFSATVPLPAEVDEMALAGFIRRESVELVQCLTSELLVPAHAELVIEGYLDPGETVPGGAFGNHTGYYVPGGVVPLLHVTAISRREKCLYPATVVGPPPMEDCYLAKGTERLLLPLLRREVPELVDVNLPLEGIFHGCALVSVAKSGAGQGRQVINRLWSAGWLRQARLLVALDRDVDVHDLSAAAWRVINNVVWSRDLLCPQDATESGTPFGGRLGIDATRKLPGELAGVPPAQLVMNEAVREAVQERWREYGF